MREGPDYDVDGPFCPPDGPGLPGYTQYATERLIYEVGAALRMLAAVPEVMETVSHQGDTEALPSPPHIDCARKSGQGLVDTPSAESCVTAPL